jgi:sugar lactone lactonase YvrE
MKKNLLNVLFSAAFFSFIILAESCTKVTTAPTVIAPVVTTNGLAINVTSTTAQSGGIITNDGNQLITANGVCYSATNQTPTTADSKTSDPVSNANVADPTFTSNLTGLTPNTVYYVRAYATNGTGTGYGAVVKFTSANNISAINVTVTTFAGNGTPGYADGMGTNAMFNNPQGITVDSKGNIYVSDTYNNYIREISPAGVTTTIAGNGGIGFTNGPAASAQFYAPQGLAFDATGNLYVADFGNNVIRKISQTGGVSTYIGTGLAGYNGGTDTLYDYFNNPSGIAFNANGGLYIADRGNNAIRKVTPGRVVSTLAGNAKAGYLNATYDTAYFNNPNALVVDASGNTFVADQGNHCIRKITPAGVVTTAAGSPVNPTLINIPSGIAIDKSGNLYIVDEGGRVMEYTTTNDLYILAGALNTSGFANGSGATATFNNPQGIAVDASGNIYVADQGNNCIRKITVKFTP